MECRLGCGACCIAPSITSSIPGMPNGKPAGVRCIQLNEQNHCKLWQDPSRPKVCGSFPPSHETCGEDRAQALHYLLQLESATAVKDRLES